jgi:hypothetical protein
MIKMEVDNVTEIIPQDDFEFQMNVSVQIDFIRTVDRVADA